MTIKTRRVGSSLEMKIELQGQIIDLGIWDKAYVECFSMGLKDAHDHLEDRISNWGPFVQPLSHGQAVENAILEKHPNAI